MTNSQHNQATFKDTQQEFTAYIRDPKNHPVPNDVKTQRMEMYRTLMFNNVESFLSSNFPVLRKILDDSSWYAMAQDFFSCHASKTPYFSEIAEEFLHYLENERKLHQDDPGFMLELAHYEWVEMAASIATENLPQPALIELDENSTLSLSPLAWPLAYQYPVHRISLEFQPTEAPEKPTLLLVFRDRNDEVRFLELTPITYQMVQLIEENEGILLSHCQDQLVSIFNKIDPVVIKKGILQTIDELLEKEVVFLKDN